MQKKLTIVALAIVQALCAWSQQTIIRGGSGADILDTKKGQKVKEISREIDYLKNQRISISASNRNIEVRTWNEPKIGIKAEVNYDSTSSYSEADLWRRANIEISDGQNFIKIKADAMNAGIQNQIITGGKATTIGAAHGAGPINLSRSQFEELSSKKSLVIYVPSQASLEILNRFSDIHISSSLSCLDLELNNGRVITTDVDSLILHSKFSWGQFGNIRKAHIVSDYGRFFVKSAGDVNSFSNYSTIEISDVSMLLLNHSNNDTYEIGQAKNIKCQKDYGELRIERLSGQLEFEGTNSDIKVRDISSSINLIKINDQFADIWLPVRKLQNYSIDFTGEYTTVLSDPDRLPRTDSAGKPTTSTSRFFSNVGSSNENKARFEIRCASCKIDFY